MTEAPVALVTGSSRGIGLGVVRFLAARGYRVIGCSRSTLSDGEAYQHRQLDVTDEIAVRTVIADIAREFGRLDLLINNAGVFPLPSMALLSSTKVVESTMRTNFLGTFLVSREAAKVMAERRYGRIVNLASAAVPLAMEGASAYSTSKAAIIQFSRVFAKELVSFNVTCNVVAPSLVDTHMLRGLKPESIDAYLRRLTITRFATIEDVCDAVWFFGRPESGYVTGQVLYLGLVAP